VWHDSFIRMSATCVMSHIWMSHVSWHDSFIRISATCVMSHIWMSHVSWHDSFIRISATCVMSATCRYVWHDSFICVTWLIHMCDMTHSYVWDDEHDSEWVPHVECNENACQMHSDSCHTDERVMSHGWTSYVTLMNESCHTDERVVSHRWTSQNKCQMDSEWVPCHTDEYTHSKHTLQHTLQHTLHHTLQHMTQNKCHTECLWYDSSTNVTWLIYLCDLTHSPVWYDSERIPPVMCVIWLTHP